MSSDRTMNNYYPGLRKSQVNLSNLTTKNATVKNKLITDGDVKFKSSLTVNDNIETVTGDITSGGFVHASTNLASGVVVVDLFNTGGGAVAYNPLNSSTDVFVDSTKGNIFSITAPSGSSLSSMYLYFNSSYTVPETVAAENGTVMTILFLNSTSRTVTVNISGSLVKRTSNTIVIPSGNRSNIVFCAHSGIISEISRSGAMGA